MSDVSTDNLLALGPRMIVREVRSLFEDRARAEVEIEERFQSERKAIEKELAQTTERLNERLESELAKAEQQRSLEIKRITAYFDGDEEAVKAAYKSDREALIAKANANKSASQKKLEEAIWLTESLYEASRDQPREEYEQAVKVLQSALDETAKIEEEARRQLQRSRLGSVARPEEVADAPAQDVPDPRAALEASLETARSSTARLRTAGLFKLFRGPIVPVLIIILAGGATAVSGLVLDWQADLLAIAAGASVTLLIAAFAGLYFLARKRAAALWRTIGESLATVRSMHEKCLALAAEMRNIKAKQLLETRDREVREAKEKYEPIINEVRRRRDRRLARIDQKYPARLKQLKAQRAEAVNEVESKFKQHTATANEQCENELKQVRERAEQRTQELQDQYDSEWSDLESRWKSGMARAHEMLSAVISQDERFFPAWSDDRWNNWCPPEEFAPAVRFGRVEVDLSEMPGGLPTDERLQIAGETKFTLPAALAFPDQCSLLIEATGDDGDAPMRILQTVMLRLLTCLPPGKVRFTILDPVGLGQNFAGFMHLADYNDAFVGGRIWTESRHIEQRLLDLTEHMENVIQKYLRNEFETIDQYNQQAGEIAEPYRFLVISDFPVNFSETSAKRLASILQSGARCGVYTLIARDTRHKMPQGLDESDLHRHNIALKMRDGSVVWDDDDFRDLPLTPDDPPSDDFITRVLHVVGRAALDSTRVEVPFDVIAPPPDEIWSQSSSERLRVALGRSGATKLQYLTLGVGTAQHALIAGKTGSGKSTLLHALITNLTLWFSPDEVELYLVDFKKGVEFKTYATHQLPHFRAIAIESDREFGISVLQRLDEELARRGELFRKAGVQDLNSFRKAVPGESMPRTLLIIDEFQELFTEDDKIAQDAAMLLDRLVRQGRAFGIHVILGSQTLGGAYSLARSTIGQMAVRIALQCSEADSYLILSDDNSAARLLSRPGEAIYNDAAGTLEGNSPFQVVWLPDERRERFLGMVQERVSANGQLRQLKKSAYPPPIVFEGNVPAKIEQNDLIRWLLESPDWVEPPAPPRIWFGEAISIKDPTSAALRRLSGNNLLMVGQRDEAALAILSSSLVALAAQCRPNDNGGACFYFLDGSPAETAFGEVIDYLAESLPHGVRIARIRETPETIAEIAGELDRRQTADRTDLPPIFLFVYGAQRFRALRQEDSFSFSMDSGDKPPSPEKQFADILREGPPLGIHTIAWCDTVSNVNRTFDRQTLRDFELRILFQMSPADSSHLIDSPAAAKLGFHRALFYAEEDGRLEKFRPYALPPRNWLASVRELLDRKTGAKV